MRRYLFAVLSTLALAATVPAVAVARDHGRDHRDRGRDRVELRHRQHPREDHFRPQQTASGMDPADAGTVRSFRAGVLTLALNDGTTVSGIVNRATEIECEAMDNRVHADDGGPGPSGGSDRGRGDGQDTAEDRGDDNDASDANASGNGNENQGPACAMALQTPGTHVRDATLRLTGARAVWNRVDLDI